MKKSGFSVVWDEEAKQHFKKLLREIKIKSPRLAELIKSGILERITHATIFPNAFEKDGYKTDNDGSYRKIFFIHLRLIYKIDKKNRRLIIVRVRHAASEPINH